MGDMMKKTLWTLMIAFVITGIAIVGAQVTPDTPFQQDNLVNNFDYTCDYTPRAGWYNITEGMENVSFVADSEDMYKCPTTIPLWYEVVDFDPVSIRDLMLFGIQNQTLSCDYRLMPGLVTFGNLQTNGEVTELSAEFDGANVFQCPPVLVVDLVNDNALNESIFSQFR